MKRLYKIPIMSGAVLLLLFVNSFPATASFITFSGSGDQADAAKQEFLQWLDGAYGEENYSGLTPPLSADFNLSFGSGVAGTVTQGSLVSSGVFGLGSAIETTLTGDVFIEFDSAVAAFGFYGYGGSSSTSSSISLVLQDDQDDSVENIPYDYYEGLYFYGIVATEPGSLFNEVNIATVIFGGGEYFGTMYNSANVSEPSSAVPLPAAFWLMASGLGGLAAFRKRLKR